MIDPGTSDRKIDQDSFPHSKSSFHTSGVDGTEHLVPLSSSLNVAQSINRTNLDKRQLVGFSSPKISKYMIWELHLFVVTYCNYGPKEKLNEGTQAYKVLRKTHHMYIIHIYIFSR